MNLNTFGMTMPGRSFNSGAGYRYGFNGKELNPEMESATYDYDARIYDARIGRWFSMDNVIKVELSPFAFSKNNPVIYIDRDGNDEFYFNVSYNLAKKVVLKDGIYSYYIPMWNERKVMAGMHRYYFKTGETKELIGTYTASSDAHASFIMEESKSNGYQTTYEKGKNGGTVYEYRVTPTYIQVNSPMTIKGGDNAKVNGFTQLEGIDHDKAVEIATNFAKTVKPSATISDPFKLMKLVEASGHGGALDFKSQLNLQENTLYNINGTYYNKNEAGNFYYGYALAKMNFSQADLEFIAHQGTQMINGKRSFDEPWELDALLDGFNYYTQERTGNTNANHANVNMYTNPNVPPPKR